MDCPKCGRKQWSVMDKRYLETYGCCWLCDKTKWAEGELSLEEFEKREEIALKSN